MSEQTADDDELTREEKYRRFDRETNPDSRHFRPNSFARSARQIAEETDIPLLFAAFLTSVAFSTDCIRAVRWNAEECPDCHSPVMWGRLQKSRHSWVSDRVGRQVCVVCDTVHLL